MDYMKFVNYHRETNADITIGALPAGPDRAKEFGLMKIDEERKITVGAGPWGVGGWGGMLMEHGLEHALGGWIVAGRARGCALSNQCVLGAVAFGGCLRAAHS